MVQPSALACIREGRCFFLLDKECKSSEQDVGVHKRPGIFISDQESVIVRRKIMWSNREQKSKIHKYISMHWIMEMFFLGVVGGYYKGLEQSGGAYIYTPDCGSVPCSHGWMKCRGSEHSRGVHIFMHWTPDSDCGGVPWSYQEGAGVRTTAEEHNKFIRHQTMEVCHGRMKYKEVGAQWRSAHKYTRHQTVEV
jgi:hypothetical protein